MKESIEVRDALFAFFEAVSSNAADRFDDVVSVEEGTLVIGTAPGELVRERDRLEYGFRVEGYRLSPGPDPRGYAEGSLGWVVDERTLHMPDGTDIATRLTAVMRRDGDAWKMVHAHFSVGVPDEEVAELQRRWSG